MNKRITKLREVLCLTKTSFANKLGMTESAVRSWESGVNSITESSIMLIEFVFNVNPQWLREGEGDMFMPVLQEDLVQIVEWLKTLPPKKQIWAAEEIKRHIPELEKWINE